ncbi:hypothetical protein T4E_9853 [Trichinella pseudospiralis]|uniref:Uncharacterized protein n=1 Tax=Trichinella pseudospiralis TaxID=6337 RepID=A0A0V0YJ36_TRIPS|nr:hypothetical protein T4E_9853 [Trichinella pseudospiralis]
MNLRILNSILNKHFDKEFNAKHSRKVELAVLNFLSFFTIPAYLSSSVMSSFMPNRNLLPDSDVYLVSSSISNTVSDPSYLCVNPGYDLL